ncbi:hypothetical protein [Cohnella terricola]|uniref:Uncharacterized protein n=1 Tax=Cohnella terricola TaxID=1289167 RepID=A0A559J5L7_9BACL|nr:hypothetical protein [Cohnella terricola]TVX95183.1 hypothetical protein FPZ45_23875 [Cohnella terricola]
MDQPIQETQPQVLYQADPNAVSSLRSLRDRIHHICGMHTNRTVRVQTLDGNIYEGVIVQSDSQHVYLKVANTPGYRAYLESRGLFFGPTDFAILTLVLFELLVIVLLA